MSPRSANGLIIAAPSSGSGKTVLTLGLLRALRNRGVAVAAAKAGPDYIDPRFHTAACGRASVNLDPWAMRPATLHNLLNGAASGQSLLVVEGVMGLFDGADGGAGSTADLAAESGLPVVLVVDVRGQAQSAAALVRGFSRHREDVHIAGVIVNRTGGPRHLDLVAQAMSGIGIPLLGGVPRGSSLELPSRHLGLVQADEHPDLETFLDRAADAVGAAVDLDGLTALARPLRSRGSTSDPPLVPLGQRIAVAADEAFAFSYPHVLDGWRRSGAEIRPFSPLADEAPAKDSDAVYLPGGYPELHAGRLSGNARFMAGLAAIAAEGRPVYGECGGYMVLGRGLVDAGGHRHRMAGLLPVETTFADRRLTLGYRETNLASDTALGPAGTVYRGHEFHFAKVLAEEAGPRLFTAKPVGAGGPFACGHVVGSVAGSFLHLIDGSGSPRMTASATDAASRCND